MTLYGYSRIFQRSINCLAEEPRSWQGGDHSLSPFLCSVMTCRIMMCSLRRSLNCYLHSSQTNELHGRESIVHPFHRWVFTRGLFSHHCPFGLPPVVPRPPR